MASPLNPTRLYHGTALESLDGILAQGIVPRGDRAGNFGHGVMSHPGAVYLTDTYPAYYAVGPGRAAGAIVEIDVGALDPGLLRADEDYSAAISPGGATPAAVRRHRDGLADTASPWRDSLRDLGTCAHLGAIPRAAITRAVAIDFDRAPSLACAAADMSISLINFRLCGFDHRAMLAWIFGDPEPDASAPEAAMSFRSFGISPGCDPAERGAIRAVDTKKGAGGPLLSRPA